MGIKNNSNYVDLRSSNKKSLNNLLDETPDKNGNYKIIVNAFAAQKYGIKVGNNITFNIQNNIDRFVFDKNTSDLMQNKGRNVTFNVVGINSSAEGEEYFINQDVANYILGLKNHISTEQPHQYYPVGQDSTASNTYKNKISAQGMLIPFFTQNELSQETVYGEDHSQLGTPNPTAAVNDLVDLSNTNMFNDNATPYGFNGVFTKNNDGGMMLNNRIPLYSPTGMYPGSAKVSEEVLDGLLQMGSNLLIAAQILGI
jgi:hypothetical protein